MDEVEYHKMFAYEDAHWFFQGKRAAVQAIMERFAPRAGQLRILDVGCGTGANLVLLSRYGRAYGVDLHAVATTLCRQRGLGTVARANAASLPYESEQFDVVALLDILYHRGVEDVAATLAEAHRVCRPGGLLMLLDSAFEWLKGPHDVAYHGARRFSRGDIADRVAASGFEVLLSSYLNALLFPIAAPFRLVERWRFGFDHARSNLDRPLPFLNTVLAKLYRFEASLIRRATLPFGLSVVVVGRKNT